MNRSFVKIVISCLMVLSLVATLGIGCGDDNGGGETKTVIVIGDITDMTGVASGALGPMVWAWDDLVDHINTTDPIPGVELKAIHYDSRYDPSRAIPGFEWVRERGATFAASPLPNICEALTSHAEREKVPIGTSSASEVFIDPPGWVFCKNPLASDGIEILLKWVAANDPYYQTLTAPAKIGACGWRDAYMESCIAGLENYVAANPDQYEIVFTAMTPSGTGAWSGEIGKMLDCDFIITPGTSSGIPTFMSQYRNAGGTAHFLQGEGLAAYFSLLVNSVGWATLDGTLVSMSTGWWTDPGLYSAELARELLQKYHPSEYDEVIFRGSSYLGGIAADYMYIEIIRAAVAEVGAENFDGQAWYNAAIKFSMELAGYPEWSFSPTRRSASEAMAIYEWQAAAEDMVQIATWQPILQ